MSAFFCLNEPICLGGKPGAAMHGDGERDEGEEAEKRQCVYLASLQWVDEQQPHSLAQPELLLPALISYLGCADI